jgi:hypothetical protein
MTDINVKYIEIWKKVRGHLACLSRHVERP